MIIVTGGAGFIGSNLVHALCAHGEEVIVVDEENADRKNLSGCPITDYLGLTDFREKLDANAIAPPRHVFHLGACSDTTVRDAEYMLQANYAYSKSVLRYCLRNHVPLVYASSAAVYGQRSTFVEASACEAPVNVYGYSKYLFDCYVRRVIDRCDTQLVGLRYFNVYGPREAHKDAMASVAYHFARQLESENKVRLFEGYDGYGDGEQRRDFVYIDDVVAATIWFMRHTEHSGIFNIGTGKAASFNDVAQAVINWYQRGKIEYIGFPAHLRGGYQSYTQANLDALRNIGFCGGFRGIEEGIPRYLEWLAGAG